MAEAVAEAAHILTLKMDPLMVLVAVEVAEVEMLHMR